MDIVDDIERCTHLVMPVLTITTKLIRALVFGCRIVSPEYIYGLEALPLSFKVQNPTIELVDEFVGCLAFMPPIQAPMASPESPVDVSTVNWNSDSRRQSLFDSKLFAFADKSQMNKFSSLIMAAGGSSALLKEAVDWAGSRSHSSESFQTLCASLADSVQALAREAKGTRATLPLTCLLLPPSPLSDARDEQGEFSKSALITTVARLLGVRPIAESEIGLAVLFVSSETHTSPTHGLPLGTPLHAAEDANQVSAASAAALESVDPPRRRRVPRISSFWNDKVADIQVSGSMPSANLEDARVSMEALSVISQTSPTAPVSEPVALEQMSTRPRRRVGVEGFWANVVSASEKSTGSANEAHSVEESDSPSLDTAPARFDHRTGLDGFWANAVSGSSQLAGALHEEQPAAGSVSHDPDVAVNEELRTESQQSHGQATVERVSLVRPKHYPTTCQAEHSSNAPNFKRFKKTVHPYQQA
ncbi:hypothetical protein IWW38_001359 [Coemansia aciculifera]|uniref:Uncharacterized protein n=1 Tax=Coemansia aciculifera TaxID=417176 RepID=A0ACC1M8A5_9FUNG|nr:hypothetical protein IWW38_001359 [Coemansia aciculifera]